MVDAAWLYFNGVDVKNALGNLQKGHRFLTQDHWDFVNQNYWDFMIKIIEILTQNRRDFNPKIIEILTLKSWFQPEFFKISTRNVRCLDKPEICPPPRPRLQIKDTEYFISNMVTILNICVIFFFSLEKNSSTQKKNELHGFFFYWIRK